MSTPPLLSSRYVTESEIQDIFNAGPYRQLIENGQLTPHYLRNAHLTHVERGNHPCTQRQMIRYLDLQGDPVVEIFQYLRADGTLGASGKPDPKKLWLPNEILIVEPKKPEGTGSGPAG
jgi:hypothetical protein